MQQEHEDAIAEEGHRDRDLMCRGVLHPHNGRRGGVHIGRGYVQISEAAAGPAGQQLAVGPPKYQKCVPSLGIFRHVTREGGGGSLCYRNVLSGVDVGCFTLWGIYLGDAGGNGKNIGGGTYGFPQEGDRQDSKLTLVQDLEEGGVREFPQGSGEPDT